MQVSADPFRYFCCCCCWWWWWWWLCWFRFWYKKVCATKASSSLFVRSLLCPLFPLFIIETSFVFHCVSHWLLVSVTEISQYKESPHNGTLKRSTHAQTQVKSSVLQNESSCLPFASIFLFFLFLFSFSFFFFFLCTSSHVSRDASCCYKKSDLPNRCCVLFLSQHLESVTSTQLC